MENWNYSEFLAFVLLYAANADFEENPKEIALIESKVGSAALKKAHEVFDEKNDYQRIEFITSFQNNFFADQDSKKMIYADMEEVFMADKDFSLLERNEFMMIKKIIG
jgi:hypothetical protein